MRPLPSRCGKELARPTRKRKAEGNVRSIRLSFILFEDAALLKRPKSQDSGVKKRSNKGIIHISFNDQMMAGIW